MASIQCAIELYDGVSPVLGTISDGLDGLAGKFEELNEGGALFDSWVNEQTMAQAANAISVLSEQLETARTGAIGLTESLGRAGAAAVEMTSETAGFALELCAGFTTAEGAVAEMASVVGAFKADLADMARDMSEMFSAVEFETLEMEFARIESGMSGLTQQGQLNAERLVAAYSAAGEGIGGAFGDMSNQARNIFDSLGAYINSFAASLPSYFSGPLNSIASMFSTIAASARASLASITSAASSTAASVRYSAASITANVASANAAAAATLTLSSERDSGTLSGVSLAAGEMEYMIFDTAVSSKDISLDGVDTSKGNAGTAGQTVINVEVSNENYISSEADVDAILSAFEDRLTEAVLSSAEGVY